MSTLKSAPSEFEAPDPGDLAFAGARDLPLDWSAAKNSQRALLNILEDFAAEKVGLEHGQRAMLNILHDSDAERTGMEGAQRAVLNILHDFSEEKSRMEETHCAVLNILEDFEAETSKVGLALALTFCSSSSFKRRTCSSARLRSAISFSRCWLN